MATKLATIIADFRTSLATKIEIGGTTATLQSATDEDGVALPAGEYSFTLNGDNAQKEYIVCTLSGTSLTAIKNVTRQGVQASGTVRSHRVGSSVTITNFTHIKYINDLLDSTTDLDADNPLAYDGDPDLTGNNRKLATVKLVEDTAISGGADASTSVKGISKLSTAPVSATDPIAVGDNDPRVPTADENDALAGTSGTPSTSNKYVTNDDTATTSTNDAVVRADGSGKINDNWLSATTQDRSLVFTETFLAGEDLTSGDAVRAGVEDQTSAYRDFVAQTTHDSTYNIDSSSKWQAQSFLTDSAQTERLKSVVFRLNAISSSGTNRDFTIRLHSDDSGEPGSTLYSFSDTQVVGSSAQHEFEFPIAQELTANTVYWVSIDRDTGGQTGVAYNSSSVYADGYRATTVDSGANWTQETTSDLYLKVQYTDTEGRIYKTSAAGQDIADAMIGFSNGAVSAADTSVRVDHIGVVTTQTGISPGSAYYLTNTAGTIGTVAGTIPKKVAVGLTSTDILSTLGY